MPIDPMPMQVGELPHVIPPQTESPLETLAKIQAVRQQAQMAPLQQQAAQQNIAQGALELQQKRQELADNEKLRRAWMETASDPNGFDPGKMLNRYQQLGGGPKVGMAAVQAFTQQAEARAKLSSAESDALDKKHDQLHSLLNVVDQETDPQKQAFLYNQQMQQAIKQKLLSPDEAAAHPYQGPASVKQYILGLNTEKWLTAQGAAQRGQAAADQAQNTKDKTAVELPGLKADAEQKARANASAKLGAATKPEDYDQIRDAYIAEGGSPGVFPPSRAVFDPNGAWKPNAQQVVQRSGMTSEQRTQADQAAANATQKQVPQTEAELALAAVDPKRTPEERAAFNQALRRLDQSKIAARPVIQNFAPGLGPGTPGGNSQDTGQAFLDKLPPGTAAQVKAIAEGRATMPNASTRSQAALQLRDAVFKYDPSFSDQRAQIRKAFTSGADGRNIGALNTAAVHLDQFADAADALSNGSFRPGNQVFNALKSAFGSSAPTNFESLKSAVAGEMASALKGNATDPEIANMARNINGANSPAQLAGAVRTNLDVLRAKLNTYQERYQQQSPGDTVWSPVLPSAQRVFDKRGVAAPNVQPNAATSGTLPQGGGKVIDKDTAKKFYQAAGNDPAKARTLAQQNGWKVQ